MIIAGLMTGTSLDGVDVCIADFNTDPSGKDSFELIEYAEYPYPMLLKDTITSIISGSARTSDISNAGFALARLYADCITNLCREKRFDIAKIEAVGVHGQTVWHSPNAEDFCEYRVASSLQLLNGPALSQFIGKPVVYDFRSADIAVGGQGAPLVPLFDFNFLHEPGMNVGALNIGGMANLTFIPSNADENLALAFDTGPGNTWIDYIAKKYFGVAFDRNGDIALRGNIYHPLLNDMMNIPFVTARPPKSTGRELFSHERLEKLLLDHYFTEKDKFVIINTVTEFTVRAIVRNIEMFCGQLHKLVISGGGAENSFLVSRLRSELRLTMITPSSSYGIPSSIKEALAFAYLAYRNMNDNYGNIPSVTGASRKVLLGAVAR